MSFTSSRKELDSKDLAIEVMLQECYFDIIVLEIFQKRETWRDEYQKKKKKTIGVIEVYHNKDLVVKMKRVH